MRDHYAKHLKLFKRDNSLEVNRLDGANCSGMEFCQTIKNEQNLVVWSQGEPFYFHSQRGAQLEAEEWVEGLKLENKDVLFIYGLGLGYYYLPLKTWLEDPSHFLVFLEDNPCVVRYFLQTALATEILENSQIMVKLIPKFEMSEDGWAFFRESQQALIRSFAFSKPCVSALNSYFLRNFDYYKTFSLQLLTELLRAEQTLVEFYPRTPLIFENFYANMPYLGETIPGYKLGGTMQSIPAVLCGAGPSLTKQLPLLSGIRDQVYLMAAGSAMNAVTQASILPHVGGAIDPTSLQAGRQLTSFGYEVPAFYQNRFFSQAFTQWQGPLLYIPGSGAYGVSQWFEEELRIEDAEQIIMGVSTSNFLLEIARFLGCNPIILVGMDLAYTNDSRYAEGVTVHPVDQPDHHEETIRKLERVIAVPGLEGKDVFTTNHWFFEAVFISAFRQRNPEITLINSTEGGMEIPGVENYPFSEVVGTFDCSIEIQGLFHGAMQNASLHKIDQDKVLAALEKWQKSLEACRSCLERMDFQALYQEAAYVYLLDTLNTIFDTIGSLRIRKLKWIRDPEEYAKEQQAIKSERSRFLLEYVQDHLQGVLQGLRNFHARKNALSRKVDGYRHLEAPDFPEEVKKLPDSDPKVHYYPNGNIKTEAFDVDGKLHGPWSFYSDGGQLLYRSYYEEGKREGACYAYYADGSLYSLLNYRQGKLQGRQLYYYADGTLKTEENYEKGLLEGVVQLYHVNGRLKKEQFFSEGRLHGHERVWDEWGKLIVEAEW